MATGIVNLRDSIYQEAMRYAKMHNVSLESFVENIIINTINRDKHSSKKFKLKSFDELLPRVQSLIGSGHVSKEAEDDINGRKARMDSLERKYGNG